MHLGIPSIIRCLWVALALSLPYHAGLARPHAAAAFCEAYPNSPHCAGSVISCSFCHQAVPPALNSFGNCAQQSIRAEGLGFPADANQMRTVLAPIHASDCDQDGFSNLDEISAGSLPALAESIPAADQCEGLRTEDLEQSAYQLCKYDHDYVYKKIWLDFCGEPADYASFKQFKSLESDAKKQALADQLDTCLDSEYWLGKDGVVWELGHYKIRPVGSVKLGEDEGILPIVDYYSDFQLFVYSQIDDNDARDQLLADYTVTRSGGNGQPIRYTAQAPARLLDGQVMQPEKRVGLLTTFWNLGFYLNYTGIARVLVAQAFRAYLGITMAQMQGLNPPPADESLFKDYDSKGVTKPECAVCHSTVDPLTYPFRNYNGLTGTDQVLAGQNASGLSSVDNLGDEQNLTPLSYALPRMEFLNQTYPGIKQMPEAGYIFGKRVENLREWAEVLVNSDQFAANTVNDYWKLLIGQEPLSYQQEEFKQLWQRFKSEHNYRVEKMLHDLILTEAYGVP